MWFGDGCLGHIWCLLYIFSFNNNFPGLQKAGFQ